MNANAPVVSELGVLTDRRRAKVVLSLGAPLGDITDVVRVYLSSEEAIECSEALKRADRTLFGSELGRRAGHFSMSVPGAVIDMDIDTKRFGIVLTVHLSSGEHYFLVDGTMLINACADGLLESALDLRRFMNGRRSTAAGGAP